MAFMELCFGYKISGNWNVGKPAHFNNISSLYKYTYIGYKNA